VGTPAVGGAPRACIAGRTATIALHASAPFLRANAGLGRAGRRLCSIPSFPERTASLSPYSIDPSDAVDSPNRDLDRLRLPLEEAAKGMEDVAMGRTEDAGAALRRLSEAARSQTARQGDRR
jgi:hypothetical protein